MNLIGYHGTSYQIDFFDMKHLGLSQGQSVAPGIYFTKNRMEALDYAKVSSEKTGKPPRIYAVEVEVNHPVSTQDGKLFPSWPLLNSFLKEYFPNWFGSDGKLLSYKKDYVSEKYSTYRGQYSLIQYAAKENDLEVIEVFKSLGYDAILDGSTQFVILDPNQILSFEEIFGPNIDKISATETIADKYIVDSKRGENYKTMPGNRFKRRLRIRQNGGNRVWYDIDINRFFKKDEFTFHIPVIGETADYIEEIQIQNWLPLLKYDIKHDGFSVQAFKRSLSKAMRTLDIKCNCNCNDFKYRHAYWFTIKGDNSGSPETRPTKITNPRDTKGRGCKHLNYVISLKTWCERIARILFNYCLNLYKQNKALFMISIARKLDLTEDMVENRPIRPRYAKSKEVQQETESPQEPPVSENPEEPAGESYYSSYYREATEYDEDQEYMIQIAKDQGVDIESYVTPKNSPEQIFEVTVCLQSHLPEQIINKLTNPDLSIQEIQVLREAYLSKIDLFPYIGFDADVLRQMLLAAKSGLDPKSLAIKGMNHRQIECLRVALGLSKDLYRKMLTSKLNYEQMRQAIKDYRRK